MSKFKIYKVNCNGCVTVQIVEAYDWYSLISAHQYTGDPIFKIEVFGGPEPEQP